MKQKTNLKKVNAVHITRQWLRGSRLPALPFKHETTNFNLHSIAADEME
jgi:hypothetical protein